MAHEDESEHAIDLVQQAVALIVNDGGADRVLEKLQDALEAPNPSGVDLALVRRAASAVEDARPGAAQAAALDEARGLLLKAAPELAEPPSASMVGGLATGTTVVLDPLEPARAISDGGDAVVLGLAAASIALGVYLSRRWRPRHSVRELRARRSPARGER
ncbi:hypothetical protein [Georgenia soli]|nr:hypothetical protein [Georgenia soli]